MSDKNAIQRILRGQAARLAIYYRIDPVGKDLIELLGTGGEASNLSALRAWVTQCVQTEGLSLDHTLSRKLDERLRNILAYVFPGQFL